MARGLFPPDEKIDQQIDDERDRRKDKPDFREAGGQKIDGGKTADCRDRHAYLERLAAIPGAEFPDTGELAVEKLASSSEALGRLGRLSE